MTTGRPAIGPQITLRAPKVDLDRLTALATEHDTTRADLIRDAITTYLGPDTTTPEITAWVTDARANAWTWWTTSTRPAHQPTWNQQVAHAIAQASMVIGLHSSDWDPDLTPVWEVIAAEYDEDDWHNEGVDWGRVLVAFANILRANDGALEHVTAHVDIVSWALTVETGVGPWSAMRPATYQWMINPHHGDAIRADMGMGRTDDTPDAWANAGRLLIRDHGWDITAPAAEKAEALLRRERAIPAECVDQAMSLWGEYRRQDAERRIGGPMGRTRSELDEWAHKLLGKPHAQADWAAFFNSDATEESMDAALERQTSSEEEIRAAYEQAVEAELGRMATQEYAEAERAAERERARRKEERQRRAPGTGRGRVTSPAASEGEGPVEAFTEEGRE